MKMIRNLMVLLFCMTVLFAPSCTKRSADTAADAADGTVTAAEPQILTNVFRGTPMELPADYSIGAGVAPYYHAETGETTFLCRDVRNRGDELLLLTFTADGKVAEEAALSFEGAESVTFGALTGERLYFSRFQYNADTGERKNYIGCYTFADGSLTYSEELAGLFSDSGAAAGPNFFVQYMAADEAGYVYFTCGDEVMVLDDTLKRSFFVLSPEWISGMKNMNGTVYLDTFGSGLVPVDREAKAFGEALALPSPLLNGSYYLGGGYDLFYTTAEGLYGYDPDSGDAELVFSFPNSDLYADNLTILTIVSPDRVIAYDETGVPVIYDRAADVDLSRVRVLEIAYTTAQPNLSSLIVQYNKANPGVRLMAKDYSRYNTPEDFTAGSRKLVNDVLNGLYQPDLVTGITASERIVQEIYQNDLYMDLYPLLDAGGAIRRDDILGCVTRTFETGDGELWAIGPNFTVKSLIGTRELLGEWENGWAVTDMIGFAQSLPDGVQLMKGLDRMKGLTDLMGTDGYSMFVDTDTGTCEFESPEFLRFLEYLAALPESADPEGGTSFLGTSEAYLLYHNGQIALKEMTYYGVINWLTEETVFNTRDVVRVGYPTRDGGTGGSAVSMTPYVITSFCEYPEEAWAFIESVVMPAERKTEDIFSYSVGQDGFPVLKSRLRESCASLSDYQFDIYFAGGMARGYYDPETWDEPLRSPGIRKRVTEEETEALIDWLDTEVGFPAAEVLADDIHAIIVEEITGYLGGAKTAEDCARIIQSRVSLWLAEHQ